ncbi:type VI secretion system protein TssA [Fluviispira vulneris]|uniref:type VI secretion system protein TssA n=1 Tax=Fluviispira vulneris TaxID=2763012 RepID=UPI001647AAB2|nr:type VI secretion system ImpA family N-terminal domain-containing protein [Fluviispira vulneris]
MYEKNVESFIEPCSSNPPCGIDLNLTDKMSWLRDQRLELQKFQSDNTAEWTTTKDIQPSQQKFANICEDILKRESKDLMIAVYYIEALFKIDSITGLLHGLKVFNILCENYWSALYPEFSEDSSEMRVIPFKLLQSSLVKLLLSYKLIENENESVNLSQLVEETNSNKANFLKNKIETHLFKLTEQELQIRIDALNEIKDNLIKASDFSSLLEDDEIELLLSEKYLNQISRMLQSALDKKENALSQSVYEIVKNTEQNSQAIEKISSQNMTPLKGNSISVHRFDLPNEIQTIEDAYTLIEKANSFILNQDPQALIPSLIKKTLSYRNLDLTELLRELLTISKDTEGFLKHFSVNSAKESK